MNTKKIGNTVYTTETIQERFDRYGEQEKTLKLLCQPLNVDVELTDDDISEMQTKITDLESELDDILHEYKKTIPTISI